MIMKQMWGFITKCSFGWVWASRGKWGSSGRAETFLKWFDEHPMFLRV